MRGSAHLSIMRSNPIGVLSTIPYMYVSYHKILFRFRIISQKEPGVISGWQLELNGQITYSRTLAKDTQISLSVVKGSGIVFQKDR